MPVAGYPVVADPVSKLRKSAVITTVKKRKGDR
jgi:hypothetical protein